MSRRTVPIGAHRVRGWDLGGRIEVCGQASSMYCVEERLGTERLVCITAYR